MTGAVRGENAELMRPQPAESLEASKVIALLTAEFLTPAEVSGLLGISRKELAEWRLKGQGPPFMLRRRGVVVYLPDDFKRYLRAHRRKGEDGHGPREIFGRTV